MSAGLHFGKPLETMGRKVLEAAASKGNRASPSALCPSDCDWANHRKLWDRKVKGPTVWTESFGSATAARLPDPLRPKNAKRGKIQWNFWKRPCLLASLWRCAPAWSPPGSRRPSRSCRALLTTSSPCMVRTILCGSTILMEMSPCMRTWPTTQKRTAAPPRLPLRRTLRLT